MAATKVHSGIMRKDEGIGLVVAVVLHAAVLAALLFSPRKHDVVIPPERIEVTISDEVGLTSTAPKLGQTAPDAGPQQGDPAPAAAPVPEVQPAPVPPVELRPTPPLPRVVEQPRPQPKPQPQPKPKPKPVPKAAALKPVEKPQPPKPTPAKAQPKPAEKTPQRKPSAIDSILSHATPSKSAKPVRKAGSSAFDSAFKDGTPGASAQSNTGAQASALGPEVRSALSSAITRQLKPNWKVPQGPDAEELVTYLAFSLNRDGSLAGKPTVVRQSGITDVNRNQAALHAENAIRAVQLAAPFDLPDQYYDAWKRVSSFKFDKRLSQ